MEQLHTLSELVRRLEVVASRAGVETTADTRMQLELALQLERALADASAAGIKHDSHAIMVALIKLLERSRAAPVRRGPLSFHLLLYLTV